MESFKVKEHNSIFDQISCRKIGENLVFNIYRTCSYKEAFTNEKREIDHAKNNYFLRNLLGEKCEYKQWGYVYHFKNGSLSSVNDIKQGFAYLPVIL